MGMRYEDLKRERVLHEDRTEIVPNPKYLRVVSRRMGLTSCKPAPTPSVAGSVKQKPDDDAELDAQECRLYRGIAGSLQYLSIDRCDVQFETNACGRLKPLARYLAGTQSTRAALLKPGADCDPHEAFLRVWSDSDWARSAKDRKKSQSMGVRCVPQLAEKRHAHI